MKKNRILSLVASAAALSLLAQTPGAQTPYHAEIAFQVGAGSGAVPLGATQSSVIASRWGSCDGLPPNCDDGNYDGTAGATSAPDMLRGYAYGYSSIGVSQSSFAIASYVFEDVVFSDTSSPGAAVPTTVSLGFTAATEQITGNDSSSAQLRVEVKLIDPNGPNDSWSSAVFFPSAGVPFAVVSDPLNVTTGTTYELQILAWFSGGGNQGDYAGVEGWVRWDDTPFLLAPGFTADSAQAGIVDNVRTAPAPEIVPVVTSDWPLDAGASENLYFTRGQPDGIGIYIVASSPTGLSIPVGTWAVLDVLPTPFVVVPFVADANGAHTLKFLTAPGISGASLGLQAFQLLEGPPDEWYSTNAYDLIFQ